MEAALARVSPDNPVAATRAVARVARGFRPRAPTEWEAFRFSAVQALRPYFERRDMDPAKAAAWAVVDPVYGRLDRGEEEAEEAAVARSGPSRRVATASVEL